VRCDAAQLALSASMDEGTPIDQASAGHVAGCRSCAAFEAGAWRVRELSRFQVAPQVPDLAPRIMRIVEREAEPPKGAPNRWGPQRRRGLPLRLASAGLAAGFVIGAVLTGGGLIPRPARDTSALAASVPRQLVGAATAISAYRATFDITELHWTKSVPRRTFVADLAFRAPEEFRVSVRDTTRYPSTAWPRNELTLITDGRRWRITGPNPCPRQALPACPDRGPMTRTVDGRSPFDPGTIRPTDVIVPMTVLAAQQRVDVVGEDRVGGMPAVVVRLAYQDATPLFQYLRFLGSWRPFFPQDRVVLWLDASSWFPLRYEVYPAAGPERSLWATQNGLPRERPDRAVFSAAARPFDPKDVPRPSEFRVGGSSPVDAGFLDGPGLAPVPSWTAGLRPWRTGSFARSAERPFDEALSSYAGGLSWITVTLVSGWTEHRPFGVGSFAEPVQLVNGTGFYEAASAVDPRRVGMHTTVGEILVATNLPRAALLRVAGSLPLDALAQPASWRVQRWSGGVIETGLRAEVAAAEVPFDVALPRTLPAGYRPAAGTVGRAGAVSTVTILYRRAAAELDGVGLLLTESNAALMPPPEEAGVESISLRSGLSARWSPQRHLLEWIDGGGYRSLASGGLTLGELLAVARSMPGGSA
jgi:hypothetical protein